MTCTMFVASALEKVFPQEQPQALPEGFILTALRGETVSFQLVYQADGERIDYATADIAVATPERVTLREVMTVPCRYPAHAQRDANYLRTEPGLYPDLLRKPPQGLLRLTPSQWKSLWVDYTVDSDHPAGEVPISVTLRHAVSGEVLCEASLTIKVLDATLPEQTMPRTEWFHGDCLADFYGVEVFSERHWAILRNFIQAATRRGINMILTPQFTPPLDTAPGGDRTTIQLVDVYVENGAYRFDFAKLRRWVDMCLDCGVRYLEMSHLFTQWGAEHAPKVMATVDGTYKKLFGWDTPAVGGEYTRFLRAYLPALTEQLRAWSVADMAWFHISDEPTQAQLDSYRAAKESIIDYLDGFPVMDALSDYAFYETGLISIPVCAVNHIEPFLEHNVQNLWSYYCTSQSVDVTNRFFAMPSARTRVYGIQMFKYDIAGCLHWGYNFYNSHLSLYHVDPYFITDSGEAFPGGDPFLVYPGKDGDAEESIRMMVMDQAMSDLRALRLLASLKGKQAAMALVEEGLDQPITFSQYPTDPMYLLTLRNRVNEAIAQA